MDIIFRIYSDIEETSARLEISNTSDIDGMFRLRTPDKESSEWYGVDFDISLSRTELESLAIAIENLLHLTV